MFEIVVPVVGVGVGLGVGVGVGVIVVDELEELALVAGAEPELPQPEIESATTAIADMAVNP